MSTGEDQSQQQFEIKQSGNFLEYVQKMYLAPRYADVSFYFASQQLDKISAHKALLAANSDGFAKIFDENPKGNVLKIFINDVPMAAFEEFLQFFYLSDVKVTYNHYLSVLHLGHKYHVQQCIDHCGKLFKKIVNIKNVCTILSFVIRYNYQRFIKFCEEFIILNAEDVFATIAFSTCDRPTLEHIIRMDFLSCSEMCVFESCMRWVKSKCGQASQDALTMELIDTQMGDLINEIRFKSMTPQEICRLTMKYGSILENILSANVLTLDRQLKWNVEAIIKCNFQIQPNGREYMCGLSTKEMTIFSTNEPLVLGSSICGRICGNNLKPRSVRNVQSFLPIDVEISEAKDLNATSGGKVLCNMKIKLQSTYTIVSLTPPILVRPDHFYKILMSDFPEKYVHYSKELKRQMQFDTNINIKIHSFHSIAEICKKGTVVGLISTLNFNRL